MKKQMSTPLKYSAMLFMLFRNKILVILVSICCLSSCKKFVEVDLPKNQLTNAVVFNDDASATSAILGIYSRMIQSNGYAGGANNGIYVYSGLSADEFISYNINLTPFYTNSLVPVDPNINSFLWSEPYRYIYSANSIIEGIAASTGVSSSVKTHLDGEAKFIRAFCYFYLSNQFGDVPLHLQSDFRVNNLDVKASRRQVLDQVIVDLKDAQNEMNDNYLQADNTPYPVTTAEKIRPNKWTAAALLARAYLYIGDWNNAEIQASGLIQNTSKYALVPNLNSVFLKNSKEAIWQLAPVLTGFNTNEGRFLILTAAPTIVSLTQQVINSFEVGDQRKTNWIKSFTSGSNTYYYPFKYQVKSGSPVSEYSMVFRLAEQYLIRAEARTQLNNISGAQADLNTLRTRAGLTNTLASDKATLLLAIEHERQVELFSEWGHRWFDLKRTNRADAVLAPLKGSNWQLTDTLYPIPQIEIINNPNITQNSGY